MTALGTAVGRPDLAVLADGLRAAVATGDIDRCLALLTEHGPDLVRGGAPTAVLGAAAVLPEPVSPAVLLLVAEARNATGDTDGALRCYAELTPHDGPVPAGLAWRHGMARYSHGERDAGLALLRRGLPDEPTGRGADAGSNPTAADRSDPDLARLHGWIAAAYWQLGDEVACAAHAGRALAEARLCGDGGALATAHVAVALHAQLIGDPPAAQEHYGRALAAAREAGDVFAELRVRMNHASTLNREARYRDAIALLNPAIEMAAAAGYLPVLALCLANQSEALAMQGALDEAVRCLERAVSLYQRLGSVRLSYVLGALGDVHRRRGRTSQARAAYEEAIRVAEDSGDRQALVTPLAGLARVLLTTGRDPRYKSIVVSLADRAVRDAAGPLCTQALIARGWVALNGAGGPADVQDAPRLAELAAASARQHRDPAGLAQALELAAEAAPLPTASRLRREALAIWRDVGAVIEIDRSVAAIGGIPGAAREDRARGRLASARLAAAGVLPADSRPGGHRRVTVRTLGGLGVSIDGEPVPSTVWRSRKARELLCVLLAKRGRAVSREELAGMLWGDEPSQRVGHRLAVALSTLRAVLDPARGAPTEHFVVSDAGCVALNLDTVEVDAEVFADFAEYGLRGPSATEARAALVAADRAYTGDFLEHEPYNDLVHAAREELRASFLRVNRALAAQEAADRPDEAAGHLRRVLAVDPYDEPAHLALVALLEAQGQYGEGRRARDRYLRAMAEIAVPAGRG